MMNKLSPSLFYLLFLCGCVVVATAQIKPAPSWQTFTSSEGRFKASFPGTPEKSVRDDESINGKTKNYLFEVETPDRFYRVTYTDYKDASSAISDPERRTIYDATRETFRAKAEVTKIFGERDVWNTGILGRELTIVMNSGVSVRYRTTCRGNLLYRLLVSYPTADQNNQAVQRQINRFMNSFQML